jgi:hypothetical protein
MGLVMVALKMPLKIHFLLDCSRGLVAPAFGASWHFSDITEKPLFLVAFLLTSFDNDLTPMKIDWRVAL